jgi:hypothetical protein
MFVPLDKLARIRYEDRLSEADQRRAAAKNWAESRMGDSDKLQSPFVFIGIPLGEAFRSPISEPHSLDISTQSPENIALNHWPRYRCSW